VLTLKRNVDGAGSAEDQNQKRKDELIVLTFGSGN
jgi:hypothetical protein